MTNPDTPPVAHCPDCGAKLRVAYDEPRCPFKEGSGYGPCGVPRPLPTIEEAARALTKKLYSDRDYRHVQFSLYSSLGRLQREFYDLLDAIERADISPPVAR